MAGAILAAAAAAAPQMAPAAPVLTYTALGASDVQGVGASNPPVTGYVPQIFAYLQAQNPSATWSLVTPNVANISGYTAPDIVNNTLTPAINSNPDVLTLFVGANDAKDSALAGQTTAQLISVFQPAYTTIINDLVTQTHAKIVTATIPDLSLIPAAATFTASQQALAHADSVAVNNIISQVATANSVPFADLFTVRPGYNPYDPTLYSPDGFHPNDAGYAKMATLFEAQLAPEPGSATMMAGGLALLGLVGLRSSRRKNRRARS